MELFICDAKLVKFPSGMMEVNVFYSPPVVEEITRTINPSVVEFQLYHNFLMIELEDYFPEAPNCETRGYFENFQLSFNDLSLLWIILGLGFLTGFFAFLINFLYSKWTRNRGRHYYEGPRGRKNKDITKNAKNTLLILSGLSFMAWRMIITPFYFAFYKKTKRNVELKYGETKLKIIRSRLVKKTARKKFALNIKAIFLTVWANLKGLKKDRILKNLIAKKRMNKTTGHFRLRGFYAEALREIASWNMVFLGIFKSHFKARLSFTKKGQGISSVSVISFSV
jgi:hypothetical protein